MNWIDRVKEREEHRDRSIQNGNLYEEGPYRKSVYIDCKWEDRIL